jgi:predicted NAD/FAD-binding protein
VYEEALCHEFHLRGLAFLRQQKVAISYKGVKLATPLRLARRSLAPGAHTIAASPGETVENWLIRNGQTARIREMLWDPLALAALNQPAAHAAAPVFARVLAEMFGADPRAAAIGLPTRPRMICGTGTEYVERRGLVCGRNMAKCIDRGCDDRRGVRRWTTSAALQCRGLLLRTFSGDLSALAET